MSVFDETPSDPSPRRGPLVAVAGVVIAVAAAGVWYVARRPEAPPATAGAPAAAPRPAPAPARKAEPPAPEPAKADEPAPRRSAAPRKAEGPAPAPTETAAPDAASLVVETDVPGASVFVDREFVGTAPVTLTNVAPGTKRINLSAEGFEGVQRSVDVVPGENTVTLRFKEVRLNASVPVSHKHGMGGGCEGTLRATVDGLSYQTSNKNDAFTLSYAQIDAFEVNYLEKNLRVKQKGGKTWNFTDKAATNADALFVFHRDVTAAREKLAKGYTAAR
ncbi:MAG: PEGA domain-containing protein [Vicinamibacterales bacterium]